MNMTYSYYPGCTLKTKAKDLDEYGRKAAEVLQKGSCQSVGVPSGDGIKQKQLQNLVILQDIHAVGQKLLPQPFPMSVKLAHGAYLRDKNSFSKLP